MRMRGLSYILRIVACVAIVFAGLGVARMLVSMRQAPPQAAIEERPIKVTVQEVKQQDVPVTISGYGQARARDIVQVAPEIAGTVVAIHPLLEVGGAIPKGDVMFEIDPRDYQARYDEAQASIRQLESSVARLKKQYEIDRDRLKTFERSRALAQAEFDRVRTLYEEDRVGTQSNVDNAELAFNNADDAVDQLAQQVDLMPLRIQEAEASLASAKAMASLAETNLERTKVKAPFDARVTEVNLEKGQYVAPGGTAVTIADDSILEISVPLNSREARNWLRFDSTQLLQNNAWFNALERVPVQVYWTEDDHVSWRGKLARVEQFDQETRTLSVIVEVSGKEAQSPSEGKLPLVSGMFCTVRIPGKTAEDVVPLPVESVGFDKDADGYRSAYIAVPNPETKEHRLQRRKVLESHIDGPLIYIAEGLEDGDLAVLTRLVNPIENALLDVTHVQGTQAGS